MSWALTMADFQIEFTGVAETSEATNACTALCKSLSALKAAADVTLFRLEQDATDLTRYRYRVELADGRIFKQNLWFSATVRMDFNVGNNTSEQAWTTEEFVPHRPVRDLCVQLVQQFGCTRILATWS